MYAVKVPEFNQKSIKMPRKDDKKQGKKLVRRRKQDDDDSSVDSKGNIRNLIDYNYSESSTDEMFNIEDVERPPPRKAKVAANKKMRKEAGLSSESSKSPKIRRTKPILVVESESEEEEEEEEEEDKEMKVEQEKSELVTVKDESTTTQEVDKDIVQSGKEDDRG